MEPGLIQQDGGGLRITIRGLVDGLLNHRLALGDPFALAVLRDLDGCAQLLLNDSCEVLDTYGATFGVTGLSRLELRVARRLFIADRVVGVVVISHDAVSYTHLRAHETDSYIVCR